MTDAYNTILIYERLMKNQLYEEAELRRAALTAELKYLKDCYTHAEPELKPIQDNKVVTDDDASYTEE